MISQTVGFMARVSSSVPVAADFRPPVAIPAASGAGLRRVRNRPGRVIMATGHAA